MSIALLPSRTVAIEIFGFPVRWYGLLYLLAFLLASWMLPRLERFRGLTIRSDDWNGILLFGVLGVIVGGRIGYVLLYEPSMFLTDPLEVLRVWHGGMSSHGGFLGVSLGLAWILRRRNIPYLPFADVVVVPVAIGLALGRIGNFINQELYGVVTDLPWGIAIPGVEGLRHPVQLYAVGKDLLIAGVCFLHLRFGACAPPGRTCAIFLLLYGSLRIALEVLRVQTHPSFDVASLSLTRGQLYSVPIVLAGFALLWWTGKRLRRGEEVSLPPGVVS